MRAVARNLFIVAYLALQLGLPLRALVLSRHDTRGHFSWNMYSQSYRCRVDYAIQDDDGEIQPLELREHLNRAARLEMLYYRDTLPHLHRYLCATHRDQLGLLLGRVSCSWNSEPRIELVDSSVDLCHAENFGVLRP